MIIEVIVTTVDESGTVNVAPMGPSFADDFCWEKPEGQSFDLRPFQPSATLSNLQQVPAGVINFTDDCWLFAHSALNSPQLQGPEWVAPLLAARQSSGPDLSEPGLIGPGLIGQRLVDACHCFEFRVKAQRQEGPRWTLKCEVVAVENLRPFRGINRASYAVIEATILATRIQWLPAEEVARQLAMLKPLVEKTGGRRERQAWDFVESWIRQA